MERPIPTSPTPNFNDYLRDFHRGIPLLLSSGAAIILGSAEPAVLSLVDCLITKSLPDNLMGECQALAAELHQDAHAPQRAVAWLLGNEAFTTEHPGLLRYVGWIALARYL